MLKQLSCVPFILSLILSCNSKEEFFDGTVVDKVAELRTIEPVPPPVFSSRVFIITNLDSIAISSFSNLATLYDEVYKSQFSTYSEFLYQVLNQKIRATKTSCIPAPFIFKTFKLEDSVSSICRSKGIEGLLKQFVVKTQYGYHLKTANISQDQINTVAYYLFTKQLIMLIDDYSGEISFKFLKALLPK